MIAYACVCVVRQRWKMNVPLLLEWCVCVCERLWNWHEVTRSSLPWFSAARSHALRVGRSSYLAWTLLAVLPLSLSLTISCSDSLPQSSTPSSSSHPIFNGIYFWWPRTYLPLFRIILFYNMFPLFFVRSNSQASGGRLMSLSSLLSSCCLFLSFHLYSPHRCVCLRVCVFGLG